VNLLPIFEERFSDNGESKANYEHLRARASAFLAKVLKYGDEVFELCAKHAAKQERRTDRVLLSLARHNLAYLDSVNTLLAAGCVDGCDSLLRSILDATFGIAHIVQEKSAERAAAYQVVRMKRHIKHLRRGDRSHPDGQQLERDLATDVFVPGVLNKLPNGLADKAAEHERWMAGQPDLVPILAEWDRLKQPPGKPKQKDPEWYTLFGGAKDIRGLAKQLRWQSLYDFFYREWSNTAHAGNALDTYATADNCIRPHRYPAGYVKVLGCAFALSINGLEKLASFYDAVMGQQVRDFGVQFLNPEYLRIGDQIDKSLAAFK
jgi:hypothetical protein